ncbi:hypothetical protein U1Q18_022590 [Sarracenia purpurea var. burkii]
MEGEIDANAPLDYAEFQLFPSHDRFEACVYNGDKVEIIASGLLGQLVLQLPELKDLFSKGPNASFKLQPPKDQWFTKSTLTRFLHIIGSPNILNTINAIEDEITKLEEAKKFHFSLYTKDHRGYSGDGAAGSCNLNGVGPKDEVRIVSSDASKNELLQAMDLRLTALRGELAASVNRAAGATCSLKHIFDMEKLSQHLGAVDLRNTLQKFVELSQMGLKVDLPSDEKSPSPIETRHDRDNGTEWNNAQILKPSHKDTPVKYGVSPAKAAQVEREMSTESEESSFSSEDDQPSVERSRNPIRSALHRRSASPMRRVQIGRSGSRKSTALTIKSLNYFPARDGRLSNRDATGNSSEDEGSEHPPKRLDSNGRRMSVQDAINLFESKQRDQTSDIQKRRSTLDDAFSGTNKSVVRRWSTGTGESSNQQQTPEIVSESSVPMTADDHLEGGEIPRSSLEAKPEPELISTDKNPVEAAKIDAFSDTFGGRISDPVGSQTDNTLATQSNENTEMLTASAKWNQQKEVELDQMLQKIMESMPIRHKTLTSDNKTSQVVPLEQQMKKDKKLPVETAGKRAEKETQLRAMKQTLHERKAEFDSSINDGRKSSPAKPQNSPHRSSIQSANPKKESSKPAVAKIALSKASPSPAIRKSWSSTPSPRATTGTSPAKTPCGTSSAGTAPTRRKTQPAPTISRSRPMVERSLQRPKNVKAGQNDAVKSTKTVTKQEQQPLTKNGRTAKTKIQKTPGKDCSVVAAKPSFYSKVTKKSSVVPLELKPFLRKGSGIGPGVGPVVVKTKSSSQPEETLKNSANLIQAQENEVVTDTSGMVIQEQEGDFEVLEKHGAVLESETQLTSPQKCDETVSSEHVAANCDDSFIMVPETAPKTEAEEESVLSPTAWVEIEEHQDLPIPCADSPCQSASSTADAAPPPPVVMSSPRVRHSLSQIMLLEESAEPDIIEWGNAENPPTMVYQKDSPKGLKRLLKFARKSRADPNLASWSTPSVFLEGEDDADESKALSNKNADNLRRKAALQAKNYSHKNNLLGEGDEKNSSGPEILSAHLNTSKFSGYHYQSSSHKLQDHISVAATNTKASRSFFSLSAFRGSKPNETNLH